MVLWARILSFLVLCFVSASSFAQAFQLTFEGLQNSERVEEFYNGGTGSLGSEGPNYGVSFSPSGVALIGSYAGGSGNFANEPSPSTILYWPSGGSVVMNVPAGFTTGFSFYYSSSVAALVSVYDGLDGTGNLLGTISLEAQGSADGCASEPPFVTYCNWTPVGVSFAGVARSVDFAGGSDQTGYDNITFGSSTPVLDEYPIPTLSQWSMILLSVALMMGVLWQRKRGL